MQHFILVSLCKKSLDAKRNKYAVACLQMSFEWNFGPFSIQALLLWLGMSGFQIPFPCHFRIILVILCWAKWPDSSNNDAALFFFVLRRPFVFFLWFQPVAEPLSPRVLLPFTASFRNRLNRSFRPGLTQGKPDARQDMGHHSNGHQHPSHGEGQDEPLPTHGDHLDHATRDQGSQWISMDLWVL